ncbi:MAG: hypothetical protein NTY03_03310 [Candidatus Bathyarchaeota archaeon]|nr:hypothetical protein [Candidatus Bathyarchaeota archaeon]
MSLLELGEKVSMSIKEFLKGLLGCDIVLNDRISKHRLHGLLPVSVYGCFDGEALDEYLDVTNGSKTWGELTNLDGVDYLSS